MKLSTAHAPLFQVIKRIPNKHKMRPTQGLNHKETTNITLYRTKHAQNYEHSTTNYSSCNPTSMHISKNQQTSVKVSETIDDVTKIAATV